MNNKNKSSKENTNKYLLHQENSPYTNKKFKRNINVSKANPGIKNKSTSVANENSHMAIKNKITYMDNNNINHLNK